MFIYILYIYKFSALKIDFFLYHFHLIIGLSFFIVSWSKQRFGNILDDFRASVVRYKSQNCSPTLPILRKKRSIVQENNGAFNADLVLYVLWCSYTYIYPLYLYCTFIYILVPVQFLGADVQKRIFVVEQVMHSSLNRVTRVRIPRDSGFFPLCTLELLQILELFFFVFIFFLY